MAADLAAAARQGLANAVDPQSPDFLDFTAGRQNLVDASFLCLAFWRAPKALWEPLADHVKAALIRHVRSTNAFTAPENNWLLFAATIEAWLAGVGEPWRPEIVDYALARHGQWYKGDGAYGDGPDFHWDYYNSYVIQPMLVELLDRVGGLRAEWADLNDVVLKRARRYAAVQERMIGPDGTFPPLGRSLAYRGGAFHHLAFMALRQALPDGVSPAQVRGALSAVHARTLGRAATFDADGWLRPGLSGHQPGLAEPYISTGSLYLCTTSFLPLGLPATAPFWADADAAWTQQKAWSGIDLPADHAM